MLDVALHHRLGDFDLQVAFTSSSRICTTALFGPSGCGKSTIVNAVCGLIRPQSGRIVIDGTVAFDSVRRIAVPPEQRACGVVFQDTRLFPHLSVAGNLRYGLHRARRRRGQGGRASACIAWDEVIALLGLGGLLNRQPFGLSGGEAQRVAIGRALLSQPRLLVMDEPLASLDAERRIEILPYLSRLKDMGLPILYVTHELGEVARLADRLVLLEQGRVLASDRLSAVLGRSDLPLAWREDAACVVEMRVSAHDEAARLTRLTLDEQTLAAGDLPPSADSGETLTLWVPRLAKPMGAKVRVRIPAREVILATRAPDGISLHNVVSGVVLRVTTELGRHASVVELDVAGAIVLARITPDAVARLGLAPGRPALALIKSMSIDVMGG